MDADDRTAALAAYEARSVPNYPVGAAIALYIVFFTMYLMPKIAGLLDAMLTKGGVQRYGGWVRFVISAAMELTFSFLQGAVSTIRTSIFMIGLASANRSSGVANRAMPRACRGRMQPGTCGPQTLFGIVVCGLLLLIAPAVFYWSLPLPRRISARDPICGGDGQPGAWSPHEAAGPVRHPGGFRDAGRSAEGAGLILIVLAIRPDWRRYELARARRCLAR